MTTEEKLLSTEIVRFNRSVQHSAGPILACPIQAWHLDCMSDVFSLIQHSIR
jgi:hypothetical protein